MVCLPFLTRHKEWCTMSLRARPTQEAVYATVRVHVLGRLEDAQEHIHCWLCQAELPSLRCIGSSSWKIVLLAGAENSEHSLVELDSQVNVKRLPPPPLKGLVKGEPKQCAALHSIAFLTIQSWCLASLQCCTANPLLCLKSHSQQQVCEDLD